MQVVQTLLDCGDQLKAIPARTPSFTPDPERPGRLDFVA
jgi:hypothetical protein